MYHSKLPSVPASTSIALANQKLGKRTLSSHRASTRAHEMESKSPCHLLSLLGCFPLKTQAVSYSSIAWSIRTGNFRSRADTLSYTRSYVAFSGYDTYRTTHSLARNYIYYDESRSLHWKTRKMTSCAAFSTVSTLATPTMKAANHTAAPKSTTIAPKRPLNCLKLFSWGVQTRSVVRALGTNSLPDDNIVREVRELVKLEQEVASALEANKFPSLGPDGPVLQLVHCTHRLHRCVVPLSPGSLIINPFLVYNYIIQANKILRQLLAAEAESGRSRWSEKEIQVFAYSLQRNDRLALGSRIVWACLLCSGVASVIYWILK